MNYAYISMISSDNFMFGTLVLYESLQITKPKYPFYLILSGKVSEECQQKLIKYGINVIHDNEPVIEDFSILKGNDPRWNYTFDKIKTLKLEQFDKIVFLDSDMYVLHNLDNLFERPHFSAVENRAPQIHLSNKKYFNSGLMVLNPSVNEYNKVEQLCVPTIKKYMKSNISLGDQNVFNEYMKNWPDKNELHLPDGYNVFWGSFNSYIRKLNYTISSKPKIEQNKIFVIHYTGPKPWMNKNLFIIKSVLHPLKK